VCYTFISNSNFKFFVWSRNRVARGWRLGEWTWSCFYLVLQRTLRKYKLSFLKNGSGGQLLEVMGGWWSPYKTFLCATYHCIFQLLHFNKVVEVFPFGGAELSSLWIFWNMNTEEGLGSDFCQTYRWAIQTDLSIEIRNKLPENICQLYIRQRTDNQNI
jgi:hypothetical protein